LLEVFSVGFWVMSSTFLLEGVRWIDMVLLLLSADTANVVAICFGVRWTDLVFLCSMFFGGFW
jgi:hypothetical protein